MSFRQTISYLKYSDRGFRVNLDKKQKIIFISFNSNNVDERHSAWLRGIKNKVGLKDLSPQPYWGFNDIFHKVGAKLSNCFYIEAEVKKENRKEFFKYTKIYQLSNLSLEKFLKCLEEGLTLIDFDARTGHNHGTKFRFRKNKLPLLYEQAKEI